MIDRLLIDTEGNFGEAESGGAGGGGGGKGEGVGGGGGLDVGAGEYFICKGQKEKQDLISCRGYRPIHLHSHGKMDGAVKYQIQLITSFDS